MIEPIHHQNIPLIDKWISLLLISIFKFLLLPFFGIIKLLILGLSTQYQTFNTHAKTYLFISSTFYLYVMGYWTIFESII